MLTKLLSIEKKNLNKENKVKLNTFLISALKNNITNKDTFYQGLNLSNLTNNKLLRIITLYCNVFIKYSINKIFSIIKNFVVLILFILTVLIKIFSSLFFSKIAKIKIFRSKIINIFSRILYFKQFFTLKSLINKRKQSVGPRLRETRIKIMQKLNFRKLLIKHIEIVRKIKLKKRQKYMLTRKVRKKKIINRELRSSRIFISEDFIKLLEFENNAFDFTNNLSNSVVSVLSKVKFVLRNIIPMLRIFEKNKKINYTKKITEYILAKFNLLSKYVNIVSKQLNTIKNLNKLFKFLFFRKFIVLRSGKKGGKIYFKSFHKYYLFNVILLIFSFIKVILLTSIVSENEKIKNLAEKMDIFLNLDVYIKQFITNIRFI